jgi:hypothetical protein
MADAPAAADERGETMSRYHPHYALPTLLILTMPLSLVGCMAYRTPGGGADMKLFADRDIQEILDRKPSAPLPANLAVARVQQSGYHSHTNDGFGHGDFSLVTVRDVERQEDFDRIAALPQIHAIAPLNRLLVGERLYSDEPLRQAAASLHTDVLLLYTLDTKFYVNDYLKPLSVFTLGLSPNQMAFVTTTASAVLLDVRTGYVYGACETTSRKKSLASAWTSDDAIDQTRLKTERESFEDLLGEFEGLWKGVVSDMGK